MKTRRHDLKFIDEMKRTVRRFIIYGQYSPEQICGRFRLKGEEKKRFGDFEIDTMIGRNRKGAIMTTNDRCTHLVLIRRLAGKEAAPLASTAIEALLPYKDKIHTITADNGKEFARHKEIAKGLDAEIEWKLNHRPRKSLGYRTPLEYCKQLFIFIFDF